MVSVPTNEKRYFRRNPIYPNVNTNNIIWRKISVVHIDCIGSNTLRHESPTDISLNLSKYSNSLSVPLRTLTEKFYSKTTYCPISMIFLKNIVTPRTEIDCHSDKSPLFLRNKLIANDLKPVTHLD